VHYQPIGGLPPGGDVAIAVCRRKRAGHERQPLCSAVSLHRRPG
jgi:hypothetical protein